MLIWAPNSPLWVAVFFASARVGSILVPLDIHSSGEFIDLVVERTNLRFAILSSVTVAGWRHAIPSVRIEELTATDAAPASSGPAVARYMATDVTGIVASAESSELTDGLSEHLDVRGDDIAEILFTSVPTRDPRRDADACEHHVKRSQRRSRAAKGRSTPTGVYLFH